MSTSIKRLLLPIKMKYFWVLVTIYFKATFAGANFAQRIIGGQDAYAGQFPFAAAIEVQTSNSRFFCGGTLINVEWILTSGHCVNNGVSFTIHLGSNSRTAEDSNRVTVASSEYFLHPDFDENSIQNDIGLIKLRMPITLTTYIETIDLPAMVLYNNTGVTVLGWGQVSDSDAELSETLKYVYVTAISNIQCQLFYGSQISDNMVCVQGNYNEGMCTGDTGGALIEYLGRYVRVVGVASFVSGNGCESAEPSGYTRTYPYEEWIYEIINSNSHY